METYCVNCKKNMLQSKIFRKVSEELNKLD